MKKKHLALVLVFALIAGLLAGCANTAGKTAAVATEQAVAAATDAPVTLIVAGGWEDCRAIETVGRKFTEQYPNCTIVYEYLQDYYESLKKRTTGENAVDIFFTVNIQPESDMLPYALDVNSRSDIDLSGTFDGLIDNFTFREENATQKKLYAIPLGAEMRGLYINKTLLDSLGITIPTDQASLLAACETLKQNGYIPFHGNPGDFSQTLLYPWVCNLIANADDPKAVYEKVNKREAGVSELLREPMALMYTLVENGYYDYKRAQTELNLFNGSADIEYARYFFNIQEKGDTWEKADDLGQIAFMPSPLSIRSVIDKVKEDYHSTIEYVFVPAPVGKQGGFVYLSPAHAIAVNKDSANLDWSARFINYLFQAENNQLFAKEFNVIPNTKDALAYVTKMYDIPSNRVCHLGQVTFDYDFYNTVFKDLLEVSKANNPKYMQTNEDGTTSLYPLEYYMGHVDESFTGNE